MINKSFLIIGLFIPWLSLADGVPGVFLEPLTVSVDGFVRKKTVINTVNNTANLQSPVGINLSALSYWSTEWPLIDLMKSSGQWLTQCDGKNSPHCTDLTWDTLEQKQLDLDENGWVRSLPSANSTARYRTVATLMLSGDGGAHPAGQYTVLYDGEGTLEYQMDAVKNTQLSQPGRDVLDVKAGSSGILLIIKTTDPHQTGNYLRNIRVIRPGGICKGQPSTYAETAATCQTPGSAYIPFTDLAESPRFHPLFLRDLRRYRVIRFMEPFLTNTSTLVEWADRPRLENARWTDEKGIPVEMAFELVRQLNADPWINIPVRASDDYVRRLAQLARCQLRPTQRIYVEYGNEIWNTAFSASNWVEEQAIQRWPDQPGGPSSYTRRINEHGRRSAEVCALWKQAWHQDRQRVQCVMGGMAGNAWVSEEALNCPLWAAQNGGHSCAEEMDALAIGPYFGYHLGLSSFLNQLIAWTQQTDGGLATLFQELAQGNVLNGENNLALPGVYAQIDRHRALADRFGLDLVAYEAGQHLVGVGALMNDARLEALFIAANRDPRMSQLYLDYLAGWRQHGGQLLMHFNSVGRYTKYGSWGAKEYQTQLNAPKYEALMQFIEANPCWWEGCVASAR